MKNFIKNYTPLEVELNRLRHFRHSYKLVDILMHAKHKKLKQIRYVKDLKDFGAFSEGSLSNCYIALRQCRFFVETGVGHMINCSAKKRSLLFPSLSETKLRFNDIKEWKIVDRKSVV